MPDVSLTVLFMPESAYGPTNNCIGIGTVLRRRGHRVVFAAESSWRGRLEAHGFEERMVDLAPPPEDPQGQDAGQFWTDFVRDTAPVFRQPTTEQLSGFVQPTFQALVDGAMYCESQLKEILSEVRPDVVVEDNVVSFPALMTAGCPFVRIVSCNPLEIRGDDIPPPYSGLPTESMQDWGVFRAEYDRTHRPLWAEFNTWVQEQGAPALPELEFMHTSPDLNLYVYPEAIDYVDLRPLDSTWQRLDSSVRDTDPDSFALNGLDEGPGGLVYLSLGSLGSADVDLMRRLIEMLSTTPHRYIVSMGPCHDELELADNMVGAEFLPQTSILPLVDVVITHGGNNTTTEALHFGKPMIVLPLFWDQYDNAQRVHESGLGIRLDTYTCSKDELRSAIDRLVDDGALRSRLAEISREIQARGGVTRAADLIEELALTPARRQSADDTPTEPGRR
jgi:MGT family glycosyltransferase